MEMMNHLFEQGRDVVLAIGLAWDELPPQLVGFEAELKRLEAVGGIPAGEITHAQQQLANLLQIFDTDPLTAVHCSSALQAEIQGLRGGLSSTRPQAGALPKICKPHSGRWWNSTSAPWRGRNFCGMSAQGTSRARGPATPPGRR